MVEPLLAKVVAVCVGKYSGAYCSWQSPESGRHAGYKRDKYTTARCQGVWVRQDGVQHEDAETGTRYEIRRAFTITACRARPVIWRAPKPIPPPSQGHPSPLGI